jgi:hypothetical protein
VENQEQQEVVHMQIRCHRGSLEESVETMQTIPATIEAIREYVIQHTDPIPFSASVINSITVMPYSNDKETRIEGWDGPTFLVVYRIGGSGSFAPFGMCSRMVGEVPSTGSINQELAQMIADLAPKPPPSNKLDYTAEKAQKYIRDMLKQMINGGLAGNVMEHTLKMVLDHPAFEQYTTTSREARAELSAEVEERFADLEVRIADARFVIETVIPMIADPKGFENNLKIMRSNRNIPIFNEAATTLGCNTRFYLGLRGKWGWLHLYNGN